MLEILKVENIKDIEDNFNVKANDLSFFAAKEKNELLSAVSFKNDDKFGIINNIYYKDDVENFVLGYGVMKSVLNYFDLNNITDIKVEKTNKYLDEKMLNALKFKYDEEQKYYYLSLINYFDAPCGE